MELVLSIIICIVVFAITFFYFKHKEKDLIDYNYKLIKNNDELKNKIEEKIKENNKLQKSKEEELIKIQSLKQAYERILSEVYHNNKEAFNKIPLHFSNDSKVFIRRLVPMPFFNEEEGSSLYNGKVSFENKEIDLISIELVNDKRVGPYFYMSQGGYKSTRLSISTDILLLPEPLEVISEMLTKQIYSYLGEYKHEWKFN